MKHVALVALALLLAFGLWFVLLRTVALEPGQVGSSAPAASSLPERVVAEFDAPPSQRSELAQTHASADRTAEPAAAKPARTALRVRGRVVDVSGQGLVGVSVAPKRGWSLGSRRVEPAVSVAGGSFELELELGPEQVQLECLPGGRYLTLRAACISGQEAAREALLVAALGVELAGTVVQAGGAPLEGAEVRLDLPLKVFAGFPLALDATVPVPIETKSEKDGRFARLLIPALAGATLMVSHSGFRAQAVAAPNEAQSDLWIELEPLVAGEPWLRGIVVREDGTPAEGARVQLDSLETKSAADGSFALEQEWADREAPLVAALRGFQPAILPRAGQLLQQEFPPAPVRLVLGGPALQIAGKILDADGKPCDGWRVSLFDGTVVTLNCVPFDLAEDFARGKAVVTKSDREGAFVLEGLLARDYVVQAYNAQSLLMLRSDPVPAGTHDLVLRVPPNATYARLAGQVVGRDGLPVGGVRVGTRLVKAASGGATAFESGPGATTDALGHFELYNIPRRFVTLDVDGDQVIPEQFEITEAGQELGLRLEVARRCHLRLEFAAGESEAPEALCVLDSQGQELSIYTFSGNGWSSSTRLRLEGAGTHPLGVSEDARTLVLYRGHEELRRIQVLLMPGEVSVVRGGGDGG